MYGSLINCSPTTEQKAESIQFVLQALFVQTVNKSALLFYFPPQHTPHTWCTHIVIILLCSHVRGTTATRQFFALKKVRQFCSARLVDRHTLFDWIWECVVLCIGKSYLYSFKLYIKLQLFFLHFCRSKPVSVRFAVTNKKKCESVD